MASTLRDTAWPDVVRVAHVRTGLHEGRGQSVGTAGKSALAAIGGGIAVRRTAYGQVIFSVVGVLELLFVGPLVAAADWVGARWRAARRGRRRIV